MRPFVILTPNIDGADGISTLARLVLAAVGPECASLITLNEPRRRAAGNDRDHRIDCDGSRSRFVSAALAAAARASSETTVIAVHLHLAPAVLAFGARGAATAAILCGIEAWRPLTRAQALALRRADVLLAISQHTADRFRAVQRSAVDREIVVCHPGVPLSAAGDTAPGTPPTALIVGRMAADERYKGHDVLIDAWPDVMRRCPAAVLRIVGDGDDRGRLEAKAATLGLGAAVQFAGRVSDERLASEYARSTLFVMPSTDEGFGLVFLEAMRAGRPCIGLRGAATEIIVDGETGVLLHEFSSSAVADAIAGILNDRPAAARMGEAGRRRFEAAFTLERFRARLLSSLPRQPLTTVA